jgi:hypothetical protein
VRERNNGSRVLAAASFLFSSLPARSSNVNCVEPCPRVFLAPSVVRAAPASADANQSENGVAVSEQTVAAPPFAAHEVHFVAQAPLPPASTGFAAGRSPIV